MMLKSILFNMNDHNMMYDLVYEKVNIRPPSCHEFIQKSLHVYLFKFYWQRGFQGKDRLARVSVYKTCHQVL